MFSLYVSSWFEIKGKNAQHKVIKPLAVRSNKFVQF